MIGRLSKILTKLNIGLQTARSILGKNMTLNSKITEGQFRILDNYVRNLTFKYKADTTKPVSAPADSLQESNLAKKFAGYIYGLSDW